MKRTVLPALFFAFSVGGCAVISGTPATAPSPTPSVSTSRYEAMESLPPEPHAEDVPKLAGSEVWVPGYYLPVAGSWVWHQGQIAQEKPGYRLLPADYRELEGKIYFTPPRWHKIEAGTKQAAK